MASNFIPPPFYRVGHRGRLAIKGSEINTYSMVQGSKVQWYKVQGFKGSKVQRFRVQALVTNR
jgi:hypothetical protein